MRLPRNYRPRFGAADAAVLTAVACVAVYVASQIGSVLNYRWHWAALPHFILRYDAKTADWVPNLLLIGLETTLRVSVWGSLVSLVAGTCLGLMRVAPWLTARLLAGTYVQLVRNMPPLVFVFIFYFFLTSQFLPLLGLERDLQRAAPMVRTTAAVLFGDPHLTSSLLSAAVALGLFTAAYVAEIVRAGVGSVNSGQWEAARALGLHGRHVMRLVVLPQALARMWAPLANELILLVKFSSLASLVSVPELTFEANQVGVTTRGMFEVWLLVGGTYFVICHGLALLFRTLEARSHTRRGARA